MIDPVVLIIYRWALIYGDLAESFLLPKAKQFGWWLNTKNHAVMVSAMDIREFLHKYWNGK